MRSRLPLNNLTSRWGDSNPQPADYKSAALPIEPHRHITGPLFITGRNPKQGSCDTPLQWDSIIIR